MPYSEPKTSSIKRETKKFQNAATNSLNNNKPTTDTKPNISQTNTAQPQQQTIESILEILVNKLTETRVENNQNTNFLDSAVSIKWKSDIFTDGHKLDE